MTIEKEVKVLNADLERIENILINTDHAEHIYDEVQKTSYFAEKGKDFGSEHIRVREKLTYHNDSYIPFNVTKLESKKILSSDGVRESRETSVEVSSTTSAITILSSIDSLEYKFDSVKRRTRYKIGSAYIDLDIISTDTLPISYVEIELEDIDDLNPILELLELSDDDVTSLGFTEMWQNEVDAKKKEYESAEQEVLQDFVEYALLHLNEELNTIRNTNSPFGDSDDRRRLVRRDIKQLQKLQRESHIHYFDCWWLKSCSFYEYLNLISAQVTNYTKHRVIMDIIEKIE